MWLACSGVLRQESGLKREQVRYLEGVGWLRDLGFLPGLGVGQGGVWVSGKATLVGPAYVEEDGVGEPELPQQSRQGWERTRQQLWHERRNQGGEVEVHSDPEGAAEEVLPGAVGQR